eukprot:CAMPEP_0202895542 /NCGR_PEP_ID=MMETSP1392-20130828/4715_1 /ASSEMBLY_ACC=CAM_ASM_000868 /TAXON_ID=225041 /ORGANISM="Chlamydomonas chlamydogama, Strain SAG 11-48b" /LENGTH=126 /DNA_ID=CAMNT_0049580577 /DNA_START=385 /DNA_END=763 /DNA_ORIENTATION=-
MGSAYGGAGPTSLDKNPFLETCGAHGCSTNCHLQHKLLHPPDRDHMPVSVLHLLRPSSNCYTMSVLQLLQPSSKSYTMSVPQVLQPYSNCYTMLPQLQLLPSMSTPAAATVTTTFPHAATATPPCS